MENKIIEPDNRLKVVLGLYLTLIVMTFSYTFMIRSEPLLPSIAFTWVIGGLAAYIGVNWAEKTSMKLFPIGTSPRKKMGIFWLFTLLYILLLEQLLTLSYGAESLLQCSSDFTGEVLVENCSELAKTEELFSPLGGILVMIATFHTFQAYKERRRKRKLSLAMNEYALEEFLRLERFLKTINRIGNHDTFFEHKSELDLMCMSVNYNIPEELRIQEPFDLISINAFVHGVRFWVESTAEKMEAELSQEDNSNSEVRASKKEKKASKGEIRKSEKRFTPFRDVVSIILWPITFVWNVILATIFLFFMIHDNAMDKN